MGRFRPATRQKLKLRMAIDGPSGAGKTVTALRCAKALAPTGRIAVICSENGAARKNVGHVFLDEEGAIQFDVEDKSEFLTQARAAAVENAQSQAQELAAAAGVELGDVQTISYYDNIPVPLVRDQAFAAAESPVPISPGTMDLTVTVNMVYFIK